MDRRYQKRMERYWSRQEAKGRGAIDRLDPLSWFDYWHSHADWYGRGNTREWNRIASYKVVVALLKYLRGRILARGSSVQSWATLCPNTMDSAVFAHSANPNGSGFPEPFNGVNWEAHAGAEIANLVPQDYELGVAVNDGECTYFVRHMSNFSSKPTANAAA